MTVRELIEKLKREPMENVVELWHNPTNDDLAKDVASSMAGTGTTWICNFVDDVIEGS